MKGKTFRHNNNNHHKRWGNVALNNQMLPLLIRVEQYDTGNSLIDHVAGGWISLSSLNGLICFV